MQFGRNVRFGESGAPRHQISRNGDAQGQRLWRGNPSAADRTICITQDVHPNQAGCFLERVVLRRIFFHPGQHESGADIGMAGERDLGLGCEDAHSRMMLRILRRKYERRFRQVEFRRNRLHLPVAQTGGLGENGKRIAAKPLARKHTDSDVIVAGHHKPPERGRTMARQAAIRQRLDLLG